jgi:hypothetical protein
LQREAHPLRPHGEHLSLTAGYHIEEPPDPQSIEVAVVALFLATDEAKFVSAAGIAIDGAAGVNF